MPLDPKHKEKSLIDRKNGNDNCKFVEERQLNCDSLYTFTAWAYSPTGLEGQKAEIDIRTEPC